MLFDSAQGCLSCQESWMCVYLLAVIMQAVGSLNNPTEKIHFWRRVSFSDDFFCLFLHVVRINSSTLHLEGSDLLIRNWFCKAKLPTFFPSQPVTEITSGGFTFKKLSLLKLRYTNTCSLKQLQVKTLCLSNYSLMWLFSTFLF